MRELQPGGLCKGEQEIMDYADAGVSAQLIADETGHARSYVDKCIAIYGFDKVWATGDAKNNAIRDACRRYAAALAATGKRYA